MKMTRKQLRDAGIPIPPKASQASPAQMAFNGNEVGAGKPGQDKYKGMGAYPLFDTLCKAHGLPTPVHEYQFDPARKWRVDYLFDSWLALEVEGGVWAEGRHTRGQGFVDDISKYNELAIAGYVLIRCTPADIQSGAAFDLVRRALASSGEQP